MRHIIGWYGWYRRIGYSRGDALVSSIGYVCWWLPRLSWWVR